jgi:hypothetical protein
MIWYCFFTKAMGLMNLLGLSCGNTEMGFYSVLANLGFWIYYSYTKMWGVYLQNWFCFQNILLAWIFTFLGGRIFGWQIILIVNMLVRELSLRLICFILVASETESCWVL